MYSILWIIVRNDDSWNNHVTFLAHAAAKEARREFHSKERERGEKYDRISEWNCSFSS